MHFKLGELFCGAGGLAWGAINAGRQTTIERNGERFSIGHAWANDLDEMACRTFAANIALGGVHDSEKISAAIARTEALGDYGKHQPLTNFPSVICGSIELLAPHIPRLPRIDAFAFGFPCNDFSSVGERKGMDGDFGPLYSYGIAVLQTHEPRWFIAENVEGLLHRDKGKIFGRILSEMETAGPGYVLTPHLYRLEEYGVPQARTRLVIVGVSRRDHERGIRYRVPAPTTRQPRTASWAMEHEPINPDIPKSIESSAHNHKIYPASERVRRRLEHTLPGQNAWNADIPEPYRLNVKNARLSMIYRRLHPDQPSYTITGNGGGGTHGYHWAEPRALTNRERARLQSFPDEFAFQGGEDSVRRQIGLAVPPLAAQIIAEAVLKSYAGIEYDAVPPFLGETAQRRLNTLRQQGALKFASPDGTCFSTSFIVE